MDGEEQAAPPNPQVEPPSNPWWTRLIRYVKRKMDERAAEKQKETPMDRAARVTANATAWIAVFTLVSVGVSVFTFLILRRQLTEMHDASVQTGIAARAAKDSADLGRALAEGNDAAYVMPNGLDLSTRNLLHVNVANTGGISATNISVEIEITRQKYPGTQALAKTQTFAFTEKMLEPKKTTSVRVYPIAGFTERDRQKLWQKEETVMLNMKIGYDNGFGTHVEHTWCNEFMSIYGPMDKPSPPGNVDCAGVQERLLQVLPGDQQWKQ